MDFQMDLKTKARWLAHCATAASWYANTQCTEKNPWGDVHNLADEGRFLYEAYKGSHWSRGAGVWAQAMAIMDLIDLSERTGDSKSFWVADYGIRYLLSLQNFDVRYPECQGAFWEHYPVDEVSLIRDGCTGCFGLDYLYAHTGQAEYLDRAKWFCDWLMKYGTKTDHCWPYLRFDFKRRIAHSKSSLDDPGVERKGEEKEGVDGDWQAGGGLALYYTGLLSGEEKYLEEGFHPMIEKLNALYAQYADRPDMVGWHGETPITYGNDDFALIALIAAFRYWKDERYLENIKKITKKHLDWMADDGSYPNFGATFVCGIEHLEYLRLAEEFGISDYVDDLKDAVMKIAEFGVTLQERDLNERFFYGGLYGQTSYGIERSRIHHRSTGYSINFYLKLEGGYWPRTFSSYGWEKM